MDGYFNVLELTAIGTGTSQIGVGAGVQGVFQGDGDGDDGGGGVCCWLIPDVPWRKGLVRVGVYLARDERLDQLLWDVPRRKFTSINFKSPELGWCGRGGYR